MSYEQRRDLLLKQMKRQSDNWAREDIYEEWTKKNKPKQGYTFKPVRIVRTHDILRHSKFKQL
jgi:hypothetical protein